MTGQRPEPVTLHLRLGGVPPIVRANQPVGDYAIFPADPDEWRLPHAGDGLLPRPCRGGKGCKQPAVIVMIRGWVRRVRYFYCLGHALDYGRWVEDGRVVEWRRVERAP